LNRDHWAQGGYKFRSSSSIHSPGIAFYKVLQQTQPFAGTKISFLPIQPLGHWIVMGKKLNKFYNILPKFL